jgi:hypothetical protein
MTALEMILNGLPLDQLKSGVVTDFSKRCQTIAKDANHCSVLHFRFSARPSE